MNQFELNRKDRRAYNRLSISKGERMLIDLNVLVEETDEKGEKITIRKSNDGQEEVPTLGYLALRSLKSQCESDGRTTGADKNAQYLVIKRVEAALKVDSKIEFTDEERRLVKERIGKIFLQPMIVGRSWALLDGKE